MDAHALFVANLPLIDRVVDSVCRRARLFGADAEDFASHVKLALISDDYAILRKWEARSSLAGYLTVVVQRLLADERVRARGRWHASAEAMRMGDAAVLLETLLRRDGRSLDEALPLVREVDAALTRDDVEAMADRLKERVPRPRAVELTEIVESTVASGDAADAATAAREARELAERAAVVVRQRLDAFTLEERMIIKLRFGSSMTVPKIALALRVPLRTVYRRIDQLVDRLRGALCAAGIDAASVDAIIDASAGDLDFGLQSWQGEQLRPSDELTATRETS